MTSAKIIKFPRTFRRRQPSPSAVLYVVRPTSSVHSGGFALLLFVTIPAAFLYLSGAVTVARHDRLYEALLAAVWGFYFIHDKLLRIRVFGPLWMVAGRLLLISAIAGFFGGIYWLILTRD